MKTKNILIVLVVIVALLFVGLKSVTSASTREAFLMLESGKVEIDSGSGWETAVDDMDLEKGDMIKTDYSGEAVVVLYESFLVRLEGGTEVSLEEISEEYVKVGQKKGTTWNKFVKLAGLQTAEIETPTSVATVRGTEFEIKYSEKEGFSIMVAEGEVEVESEDQTVTVKENERYEKAALGEELVRAEVTSADRRRMAEEAEATLGVMRDLRERELEKHKFIVDRVKSGYDLTDGDIKDAFEKVDRGEIDDREVLEKSPIEIEAAEKIIEMNDLIKKQRILVADMRVESGVVERVDSHIVEKVDDGADGVVT